MWNHLHATVKSRLPIIRRHLTPNYLLSVMSLITFLNKVPLFLLFIEQSYDVSLVKGFQIKYLAFRAQIFGLFIDSSCLDQICANKQIKSRPANEITTVSIFGSRMIK